MKYHHCPFEEKITRASRSGQWTDELLAHVAACASCEEVTLVASYFSESNIAAAIDSQLPDAGRIWFKAQVAAKSQAMERAMRPILWARRFAFGVGAALVVAFILASRPRLGAFTANFLDIWTRHAHAPAARTGNFLFLLTAAFLLILAPILFGLYSIWSED